MPMSIQVMDDQEAHLSSTSMSFQDYVKFLPEVTFQSTAPNQTTIYIRGVSDGGNGNHSGPQPSVGIYLDEQPTHHHRRHPRCPRLRHRSGRSARGSAGYALRGEFGVRHAAVHHQSAVPAAFSAGYDLQGNWVDHGDEGYVAEGFVNVPLAPNLAVRLVAFDEHDAGYIDNVLGQRDLRHLRRNDQQRRSGEERLQPRRHLRRPGRPALGHQRQLDHARRPSWRSISMRLESSVF